MLSFSSASGAATAASSTNPNLIVEQVRSAVHADALERDGSWILEGMVEAKGCSAKAKLVSDPLARRAALYAEDGGPAAGAEGVDGLLAWSKDATGVTRRATFAASVQNMVSDAYWATGGLANTHWPAQVRYQASAKLGNESADVLEVLPEGGRLTEVWISQKSHLPLQWARRDDAGQVVTAYADYRNLDGALIPFQQTVTDTEGNTHKYTMQSAQAHVDQATVAALTKMPEQQPSDYEIHGARSTTVPMRVAGQPYVDVYIDGRGPFNFMVDTGGSLTLSTQTAEKLGVPLFGRANGSGSAEATASQYAMIADVRIGDAHVHQQNVQVRDLGRDKSGLLHRHVDGVIGAEIMERFVATFDFPNQQLTLSLDHPQMTSLAAAGSPELHTQASKPACANGASGRISMAGVRAATPTAILRVAAPAASARPGLLQTSWHGAAAQQCPTSAQPTSPAVKRSTTAHLL